jgi:periplasmic divalent cation tolerance protein
MAGSLKKPGRRHGLRRTGAGRFVQVSFTVAGRAEARRIARVLVDERLAACVQITGPIESRYHWQGRTETAQERLCLAKTSRRLYPQLEARIRELHSYQVPEIVALPIAAGSRDYLGWLAQELIPKG